MRTFHRAISYVCKELGWKNSQEFHYKENSKKVREMFLKTVSSHGFFYYGIVINKAHLYGEGFKDKKSFYKYACRLVFENAKEKLFNTTFVIDRSGSGQFQTELKTYLSRQMNDAAIKRIKKVKQQRSS